MNVRALKRPLYVIGFSFALSLLAASVMGYHAACIVAVLCGVLFLVVLAVSSLRRNEGIVAALLAAGVAFSLFVSWEYRTVQPLTKMDGETVSLTLWVEEEVSKTENTITYLTRVREGDLPRNARLLIVTPNIATAPHLYDRVETTVQLEATDKRRADNVFLQAWVNGCDAAPSDERPWNYAFIKWRTQLTDRVQTRASGDVAALLRAICFGDKSTLSDDMRDGFAAAGLSHVTAVSGFHMSAISLGLFRLLCFLGLRKRLAAALSLPMPAAFAALTGFSSSALRAGVMCTILLLGAVFRRAADARNSLGAALLLLLVFDPAGVYDLGLQLSAAATWGILLAASLQSRAKTGVWYTVAHGVQLTVAAVVATLPFSALAFGRTSVLAPLTNLIAQPLAAVTVGAGCVGALLLCVPWLAFLGSPLILLAGVSAKGMLFIGQAAAAWPRAFMPLNQPYLVAWALAVPFALLLGWCLLKGRGLRITAILLAVALCLSMAVHHVGMRGVTTVTACNTGKGTVVLLARDGRYAAVSAGDVETDTLITVLERHGVKTLDLLLLAQEGEAAYVKETAAKDLRPCAADAWSSAACRLTLWEDTALSFCEGWCRLTLGEHVVLIAPYDGDVSALPEEEKAAEMAIFDRVPPQGVETLALSRAILSCSDEQLPQVTRSMMWGVYPIDIAADEAVTVKLR